MKKLIAILAGMALVGSFSCCAFAEAVSVGSVVDGMTTTYDAETGNFVTTVNANVGDQATILAFTGSTLTTDNGTNIEFIDQDSKGDTTTFTYKMKSTVSEGATYTVKVGGSNVTTPYAQTVTIPTTAPAAHKISGTVNNVVDSSFIDGDLTDYVTEIYGESDVAGFIDNYKTKAYLISADLAEDVAGYCLGDADEFESIACVDVSFTDGTYCFNDVEDGSYIVLITSKNSLPYVEYATVDGADETLGSVTLVLGDFVEARDGIVDPNDLGLMVSALNIDIESEDFDPTLDIEASALIDPNDLSIVVSNLNVDVTTYDTDFGNENY